MNKLIPRIFAFMMAAILSANAAAPTILTQPQSLTINYASTASFTVVADSTAIAYQWQFNGNNIPNATNTTLTLEDVTTNQSGAYTVVVSSSSGSVTNQPPAQLTLLPGAIVRFVFSGLLGGGTNFVDVQLFNHDKPITVQNFLQYVTLGVYSNMFFDRCLPGFVLQGGDDVAWNRTNTTSPITGTNVTGFAQSEGLGGLLSTGIANEFSDGPLIHNDFGTIAMAKVNGQPNSATSAFFFNLGDNSNDTSNTNNLDAQNSGFTVFGRVIGSATALQYFNNLSFGDGMVSDGNFLQGINIYQPFPDLPVNYVGNGLPANSNLVFCDFQFLNAGAATPALAITSPASGVVLTNGSSISVQGTTSDSLGLAWVRAELIPLREPDGAIPNYGFAITNYASGVTNWSINLNNTSDLYQLFPPGRYTLEVEAGDEAGNITRQSQPLTITALLISGNGTINVTSNNVALSNPIGYPLEVYSSYGLIPVPAPNNLFVSFSAGGLSSISENLTFPLSDGETLTATFVSNNLPGSIAVTSPSSNSAVNIGPLNVTGTLSGVASAQITCQLYDASTLLNYGAPVTITGTANWSMTLTNVATGSYTLQVIAVDPAGESTALTENFSASIFGGDTNPPALAVTSPASGIVMTNGDYVTVVGTASDDTGLAFVRAELIPLREPDGAIPNKGLSSTNYATGLTNWAVNLNNSADAYGLFPPGRYTLEVEAQDEAGNISQSSRPLTITALLIDGNGIVNVISNNVVTLSDPIGYPLQFSIFPMYDFVPIPAPGNLFVSFSTESVSSISQDLPVPLSDGEALTAKFISNNISSHIAVTYPASNAVVTVGTVNVTGAVSGISSVGITCQIFDASSGLSVTPPLPAIGTTNWAVTVTNLATGSYVLQVVAVDPAGAGTVITENFSAGVFAPLHLNIIGDGTVSPVTDGELLEIGKTFQAIAKPNAGQLFYEWSDGASTSLNETQTFTMSSNLTLTVSFYSKVSPKGVSFTSPAPNAKLTNGNITVAGRVSSSAKPLQITAQLFSALNGSGVGVPIITTGTTTWTTTNQARLSPGQYILVATAVDADGGKSFASEKFSVLTPIHLATNGLGVISLLRNGEYLEVGAQYHVRATPKAGQVFDNWWDGSALTANPLKTFTMTGATNMTLTATFISNTIPRGISITYPRANSQVTTNNFILTGAIESGLTVTQITCQFFPPSGAVGSNQTAHINGGRWSLAVTNMALGKYTVVVIAYDSKGRTTLISENFTVNFFAAVSGTYTGLFLNTLGPITATNSGFLTFQVAASGLFSGKLLFPGYGGIIIDLPLQPDGTFGGQITNFHGFDFALNCSLDLTNGTGALTGSVSGAKYGESQYYWYSQLTCYRSVTRLSPSERSIVSLQPANPLMGNGYAAVSVSGPALAYSGALPDNSAFSGSARVSKDGVWPIYVTPSGYGTKGMLIGWETNSVAGGVNGQLYWYKAPDIGNSETNSFILKSIGTNVAHPTAGSYSVVFGGGDLASPQTATVTANSAGQFVAGSADQLTLSLSSSGVLTGHIANPGGAGLLQFKGAFLGSSPGGSGFTRTPNGDIGYFTLTP